MLDSYHPKCKLKMTRPLRTRAGQVFVRENSAMAGTVDKALEVYDAVSSALIAAGLKKETVRKYSYFAAELYDYIDARPELQTILKGAKATYQGVAGTKGYLAASKYASNARTMSATTYAEKFAARGTVSAGGAISAFVDYFSTVAKGLGIEMNECSIAITKVILDVLSVIALVDALMVWGVALQLLALDADKSEMVTACFGA